MNNGASGRRVSRILTLATNTQVLSWRMIFLCAVLSVLIHLAPNGAAVSGDIWVRILIAFAAFLPGIAIILVFRWLLRGMHEGAAKILITLLSYLLAGSSRGQFFAVVFTQTGMAFGVDAYTRIPSSTVTFGLLITVAVYAASSLEESRQRISSLHSLKLELDDALTGISEHEDFVRTRALHNLEEKIHSQLGPVMHIADDVTRDQLRNLVSEVVRPLSHQLAERVPLWESRAPTQIRLNWKDVLSQITPERSLHPLLLSAATTATALTTFIAFFGIELTIPLVICSFVLLYFTARGLEILTRRVDASRSIALRFVMMTISLIAVAIPAGLVDAIILRETEDPWLVLKAGTIIIPIFGWSIALAAAAQAGSARIENEYQEAISRMSWLKARLNLVSWFEQGELARVLHGPVQSAINKGVLKLNSEENIGRNPDIISEIRREISSALSSDFNTVSENNAFEHRCTDLSAIWAGVCQIDIALSPTARAAVNNDVACGSLLWDVMTESCSNAIRHGGASWISVRIPDPAMNSITIEVINNGNEFVPESQPGLGSNLLDACTIAWNREREHNHTVLTAQLPLQL